jgi:hypothetical protein
MRGQVVGQHVLVGEWGMCQNFDNPDTSCSEPYRTMIFKADGTCQYGFMVISGQKIPVLGKWVFDGETVKIKFDQHPNFSVGDQVYKQIVVLDEDTFFSKAKSLKENPGHWSYTTFKRVK